MSKADKAAQVIGELVLYAPLILALSLLGVLIPGLIGMVCLFTYKQFYSTTVHLDKAYQCVTLSYSLFLFFGLFYAGLGKQFVFLQNQPLLLVIWFCGVAWINANGGEWQGNYRAALEEIRAVKEKPPFNCKKATEQEIREKARQMQLSDEQAGWIVDKFVRGVTYKRLCRENESEKACQVRIKRIINKLNAPM